MKKKSKFLQGLIGAIIVACLIVASFLFAKNKFKVEEKTSISSETVESSLREVRELTTLKYHYKNIASFENAQEFQGFKLPFTTKKFIYTYEGDINAGIDLEDARVSVNNQAKTITVNLPESKILSHDIDENSVKFFDEKNSIFNPLELEDFSNFRKEEEAKVEKEAIEKGLLEESQKNAKKAVEELLNINPLINEEYTIEVR